MKPLLLAACAAAALAAAPAAAQAQHMDHSAHMPAAAPAQPDPHAGHDMTQGGGPDASNPDGDQALYMFGTSPMPAAHGRYPATREAGSTAWQPDASRHGGLHLMSGGWMLMGHALLNGVYDRQSGPRGDDTGYVSGMIMGQARRTFADDSKLQFTAMLSPDPLMGRRGYPLHLASGETADGETQLVDRQHPHDLFMELSASYSVPLSQRASLFVYGGLPGAPAFGPPAFMHRQSAMDSPEAPITHHWLDSTHIAFGVLTAGVTYDNVRIEASRFNGREPDQHRYDIETSPLDSTAARIAWNPTPELSLQASWAHLVAPEQLEPDVNQTRWSASAIYTRNFGERNWWSTTLAWGRRSAEHGQLDAFALESAVGLGDWTLFARAEQAENDELLAGPVHHGPAFDVAKVSLGAIRDFRVADEVRLGVGGLYAFDFVPDTLEQSYGGDPHGAMLFVRLKVG